MIAAGESTGVSPAVVVDNLVAALEAVRLSKGDAVGSAIDVGGEELIAQFDGIRVNLDDVVAALILQPDIAAAIPGVCDLGAGIQTMIGDSEGAVVGVHRCGWIELAAGGGGRGDRLALL